MTIDKRKAAPPRATIQNTQAHNSDNSTVVQRQRLLAALKQSPKSTIELRRDLDILGVAPRVLELRRAGYDIITDWRQEPTDCGRLHRVALYVLLGESGAV